VRQQLLLPDPVLTADALPCQGAGSLFEALNAGKTVVAVPNALLMHNHQASCCYMRFRVNTRASCHAAPRGPLISAPQCVYSVTGPALTPVTCSWSQQQLADSLAEAGYCFSCMPDGLAATLHGMDPGRLKPYQPGSPRRIAAAIDRLMGFGGT
jgi:UDP-N-acetylglucosamine transferase subunit ALG13